jgi:hypothetical protein
MAVRKIGFLKADSGQLFIGDVIEHEGKLWLVPEWLEGPTKSTARPARILCLDGMHLGEPRPQYQHRMDWVLSTPLHTDILEGRRVSSNPLVIEKPGIVLRVDTHFHR